MSNNVNELLKMFLLDIYQRIVSESLQYFLIYTSFDLEIAN